MSPDSVDASTPRASSPRAFLLCCGVLTVFVQTLGFFFAKHVPRWSDFRAFYSGGYLLRTQPSALYDLQRQVEVQNALVSHNGMLMPFYHPSFEALLFAPFSLLQFHNAYSAFMALGVLCLIGSFLAARPLFSKYIPYLQPRPGLLLVFFIPVVACIPWGQDSLLFLLLFCLTWRDLERGNDARAACWLALGLFRFQLALPLAFLIAARRGRRFAMPFLAAGCALLLLSVALVGKNGVIQYLHLLTGASLANDQGVLAQHMMVVRPVYMTNLAGFFYAAGARFLAPHTALALNAIASLSLLAWTAFHMRRAADDSQAWAMALLCTVLVSYHFLPYDLGILLPAFTMLSPRVHHAILLFIYWLPPLLFIPMGGRTLNLYALPLLALLLYAGSRRFASSRNFADDVQ